MPTHTPLLRLSAVVLGLLSAAGCQTDIAALELSGPPMRDSDSGSSGGGGEASSVTITTVTSNTGSGSSTSTTTTANTDTTEGIDDAPPEILEVELWPSVITANGPITVEVDAAASLSVEILLESGASIELSEDEPGHFVGKFPVITAGENGLRTATIIAWNGDLSDEADAAYTVDLPESGAQIYWEAEESPFMGEGWVVAMGTLPTGDVVELITQNGENGRSCALRRRSPQGDWNPNSVVELLAGEECEGIDLAIDDEGTIHTLVSQKVGLNSWRWLLSKSSTFGHEPTEVAAGSVGGEEATALALRRETGAIAVCGATPSGLGDLDAFVRVYEPGEWEKTATFDHPLFTVDHSADERPSGCIFVADDRLMLVGDAYGKHDEGKNVLFFRRFLLPVDLNADEAPGFTIGPKDFADQSFATAVDTDGQGMIYVAGYACDEPCNDKIQGHLWVYDVEGSQKSEHSLGFFSYPEFAPHALAWSSAEYLVIANGGLEGDDTSFVVRAFGAENFEEPLWTFARKDPFVSHIPLVAFVGRYAQLYFGGIGENVYPGVLFLGS